MEIYFKGKLYNTTNNTIDGGNLEYAVKVDGVFKNHKYAIIDKVNKKAYLVDFEDKQSALPYGNAMNNIRKKLWNVITKTELDQILMNIY